METGENRSDGPWMPTDKVRGLKAHGPHPRAKGQSVMTELGHARIISETPYWRK
jgi:hypothetical protein